MWVTLLGGADSRRAAEPNILRMISHLIVGCATLTEQLKKGSNAKCNEYLIYGQSKYRLREGSTNTSGVGTKSPAQGAKPRTGLSE